MRQILTMPGRSDPSVLAAAAAADTAARESKTAVERTAEEAALWAVHGDPSHRKPAASSASVTRWRSGVEWVRASELLSSAGGRVAGRGIDFQAELSRRARTLPVQAAAASRRTIRDRALRLPPASAFGRRGASAPLPTQARIGRR
ncbi:hypothetical protein GCM10022381_12980 [Leifsonia kafniensis]|uniref:Uncharacterized protein n=1 Tax=Leifsonia kafniensis TaxID=475957 RepID=A0ABP7KB27_9MICO